MRRVLCLILPMLALAAVLAPAPARAASYGVRDDSHFFSASAVDQANDLIRQIRSGDDRDVLVVTYEGIPDDKLADFKDKGKDAFFKDWVQEIGRDNRVTGIVILLTKTPGHLQIAVGNKTQRVFTLADRDQLTSQMLGAVKAKDNDQALLGGLRFIKERIERRASSGQAGAANAPPPYSSGGTSSSSSGGGFSWLCLGIGILIVVFVIIRAATGNRSYSGGPGYGAPPPPGGYPPGYGGGYGGGYGYGGGGGGFGRGLLGGLLGGALGGWAYDRFSRGSGFDSSANAAPPNSSAGGDFGSSSSGPDTSYSSSGGDFDSSSSSGGDFGAGSGGGGDFGGGDSSSGGDFGGGGDSSSSSGGGGDF